MVWVKYEKLNKKKTKKRPVAHSAPCLFSKHTISTEVSGWVWPSVRELEFSY